MSVFYRIPTKKEIERLRQKYPRGTCIILLSMDDPQPLPHGSKGTIFYVDDTGQILMEWDNGSSRSLLPGVDSFSKEAQPEKKRNDKSHEVR